MPPARLTVAVFGLLASFSQAFPTQIPLLSPQEGVAINANSRTDQDFNPLHHLSGISPYWSQHSASDHVPETCNVTVAAYYIRHSSIYANDDEYEETMQPFQEKLKSFRKKRASAKELRQAGPLSFLADWQSLVNETSMEMITPSGGQDALDLGDRLSQRYAHLLPNTTRANFEVWTADAKRDIVSARAFVKGLVPKHHGGDGSGDGHVKLKKVPLADPEWSVNLTPHKICKAWTKKSGRSQRQDFEDVFTEPIKQRFNELLPSFDFVTTDIVAMFQLCGYDTVARGEYSSFCDLFTDEEILDFEYSNDLHYYYMLGHGSHVGPYLGMPWLDTATKKILDPPRKQLESLEAGDGGLPPPSKPPTDTQTQRLWAYLTHREEPPTALVALGLFNDTHPLPSDHRPKNRRWWTSRIMPFLGHVALERLHCGSELEDDYVRVMVNESPVVIPTCHDGPGESCPITAFKELIEQRRSLYDDFQHGCAKSKD